MGYEKVKVSEINTEGIKSQVRSVLREYFGDIVSNFEDDTNIISALPEGEDVNLDQLDETFAKAMNAKRTGLSLFDKAGGNDQLSVDELTKAAVENLVSYYG